MNTRSRITKLIAITMAVAAIAVIGSSWAAGPACAAGQVAMGDGSVRFISPPIGFIPGQRLSLSVLYPNEEGSRPARVQAYIYDSAGNLLSQTDPVELRPGRFHTFHFDRDDLLVAGEPETGRLQVSPGIGILRSRDGGSTWVNNLPASLELVDKHTGGTLLISGHKFSLARHFDADGQ